MRCVFKNEKGQERLHQRIFYDDAGTRQSSANISSANRFPTQFTTYNMTSGDI